MANNKIINVDLLNDFAKKMWGKISTKLSSKVDTTTTV